MQEVITQVVIEAATVAVRSFKEAAHQLNQIPEEAAKKNLWNC